VRFSSGDAGRAVHALAEIGELIESGRFWLPVAQAFPLAEIAAAHRVGEDGHVRGKIMLVTGSCVRVQPLHGEPVAPLADRDPVTAELAGAQGRGLPPAPGRAGD
jgi:hypothetical protein